jgi:rsbT co-antagonist protein RsbR
VVQGFSPSQTATFVFALKQLLFNLLRGEIGADAERLAAEVWIATKLLDKLNLYAIEIYQKGREAIIRRQ